MNFCLRPALAALVAVSGGTVLAAPVIPVFSEASFSADAPIDNPYFPLLPGARSTLDGRGIVDGEPVSERAELTFAGAGPDLLGVQTTAQRDRAFEEGMIVEDTFDYYAQDTVGNVWYFGEDVTNYRYDDDGAFLGTDSASSWLAGVNEGQPGFIMPAVLDVGFEYYQEFAPADNAVDVAEIDATGLMLTIAGVGYSDVLRTFETNPLEPDSLEYKYYAPGIGLIRIEEGLDERGGTPELTFDLTLTPVPLPAGMWLLLTSLGGMVFVRRPRQAG